MNFAKFTKFSKSWRNHKVEYLPEILASLSRHIPTNNDRNHVATDFNEWIPTW